MKATRTLTNKHVLFTKRNIYTIKQGPVLPIKATRLALEKLAKLIVN